MSRYYARPDYVQKLVNFQRTLEKGYSATAIPIPYKSSPFYRGLYLDFVRAGHVAWREGAADA